MSRGEQFQRRDRGRSPGVRYGPASRLRLAVFVAVAVVMLQGVSAQADFTGAPGLLITGSVGYDAPDVFGSPAVSGNFSKTVGGSTAMSTFNATSVTSGVNPQSGELTLIDEGFSMSSNVSGTYESEITALAFDLSMNFSNSAALPYIVTVGLAFSNSANADGADAYADSEFTLDDPGDEIFFTQLISDTVNGDEVAGDPTDPVTFGAPLSESGSTSFDILLAAGTGSSSLVGEYVLNGGVYDDPGLFGSTFSASLTILDVQAVPVPGAALLGVIGLGYAGRLLRRRKDLS